jgi:hypothetical protein
LVEDVPDAALPGRIASQRAGGAGGFDAQVVRARRRAGAGAQEALASGVVTSGDTGRGVETDPLQTAIVSMFSTPSGKFGPPREGKKTAAKKK